MAPSDKIVIDDDFIQKVHDTLDTCATTLADMWLRPVPRFNSVKVAAGADGYVPGTDLESVVAAAGLDLDKFCSDLKDDLDLQVKRLTRMLEVTDEIESLNTQTPASIMQFLERDFTGPGTGL
ncbi:hypothetical protein OHA72_37065 [Dactylosporangium sp. NBC_01737]|uniref:hypothetical protein n=1 Tax=Dactylosporangium sp. NBC_01737 TaxID=2975959 RepID=UPI002E11BFF7|nr:hypothetical protein OHA72_37065 [Dactylosporangium sp. NBC_01737]